MNNNSGSLLYVQDLTCGYCGVDCTKSIPIDESFSIWRDSNKARCPSCGYKALRKIDEDD